MKITEHNIREWKLDDCEIDELIRLAKDEMKQYSDDKATQMFCGIMIGKVVIMRNDRKTT